MFLSLADTDIAFPLGTAACYQVRDLPCLACLDSSEGKNITPSGLNWHLSTHSDARSAERDGFARHSNITNLNGNNLRDREVVSLHCCIQFKTTRIFHVLVYRGRGGLV